MMAAFMRAPLLALASLSLTVPAVVSQAGSVATLIESAPDAGLRSIPSQVGERIARGRYPGAAFAVARGDRVLLSGAAGVSNVAARTPLRADSIFELMSMTKPVTAVAAMILVEEGRLELDAPVSRTLPEFASFGVAGAPPLTLRHLMTHTSGIGFGRLPTAEARPTLAEHVREIAARRMTTPAGSRWEYSGLDGPDVIARMVEVAAGEPYDQFVRRRIFAPLRMRDTTYSPSPRQSRRLVRLYAARDGSITEAQPMFPQLSYPSGGAGLYSTVEDYLRFARMLANDGALDGVRILSPGTVAEMRRPQLAAGFPGLAPGLGFGLLMRTVSDPVAARSPLPAGAYGWSGAYGTHFWIDPNRGLAAVWMIGLANAGGAGSADALDFEQMVTEACAHDRRC